MASDSLPVITQEPSDAGASPPIALSAVIPVYQGENTLETLLSEIAPLAGGSRTPRGVAFRVAEVVLVHDAAADRSDEKMRDLAARHPWIVLLWLSRNYGQHPATLAGLASSSSEWVVTLDEDGQQDPAEIGAMLDRALESGALLVYGRAVNPPPHGRLRNLASRLVKRAFSLATGSREILRFSSFRLIRGEIARSLAAYCGHGVFLDVALTWVVGRSELCPVTLRPERGRPSGYSLRRLVSHFWRMVLSAGTRPLRIISVAGFLSVLMGIALSGISVWGKLTHQIPVAGYTTIIIVICFFSGVTLFSLGVIAEYLGLALTQAMGKPLYLTVSRPVRDARTRR